MPVGTFKVTLDCPPMSVLPLSRWLQRTAVEPMVFNMYTPDGISILNVKNVVIPQTDVKRLGILPGRWRVDPCVGQDINGIVVCKLPAEDVIFNFQDSLNQWSIIVIAKKIVADITVTVAGAVGTGTVTFPDCKVDVVNKVAEAIQAVGQVTFPASKLD